MAHKICVLGSVNLDLIIQTKTLPKAGETIGGGRYQSQPGGKGSNIALAAQRLGAKTELRAAVGRDSYASEALVNLKQAGVELDDLIVKDNHTGLAFINVDDQGENQIAVAAGANGDFSPGDLSPILADAMISQFEIPLDTIAQALKDFGGFTCLNPSPVNGGLAALLGDVDLLIVNEMELSAYGGAITKFKGMLAVTMGGAGAELYDNGKLVARGKPPAVKVIDTTGAGDSFAAALTLALLENQSPQQALEFACAVGALATTKMGAQSSSPKRAEVNAILGA